jgi:hypothetical protein
VEEVAMRAADLCLGSQLEMIADEDELLVAWGEAGQDVGLQYLRRLLHQYNFGSQATQQLLIHCCPCGGHPHHSCRSQDVTIVLLMDVLQAQPSHAYCMETFAVE